MQADSRVTAIAHVIQLAVAPVFFLTGIGAILNVLTSRLARVVDRARALEQQVAAREASPDEPLRNELRALARRSDLISRSITLCTITALLICAVIAVLFIGVFRQLDTSIVVALLFITAMAAFFAGLLFFLREILLATSTVRIGLEHLPIPSDARARDAAASLQDDKSGAPTS